MSLQEHVLSKLRGQFFFRHPRTAGSGNALVPSLPASSSEENAPEDTRPTTTTTGTTRASIFGGSDDSSSVFFDVPLGDIKNGVGKDPSRSLSIDKPPVLEEPWPGSGSSTSTVRDRPRSTSNGVSLNSDCQLANSPKKEPKRRIPLNSTTKIPKRQSSRSPPNVNANKPQGTALV